MKEYIIKVDDEKADIMGNCPLVEKPQEFVRCKDCRWYIDGICEKWEFRHPDDYFCSDAERMGRSVK